MYKLRAIVSFGISQGWDRMLLQACLPNVFLPKEQAAFLIRKRQFEAVHALLGISWPPDILTEMPPQTPAYIGARDKYIIRSCTSLGYHKPAKLQLEVHVINL